MSRWRMLTDDAVGAAEGLAFDEAMAIGYGRGHAAVEPTLRLYTYRSHCALVGRYQHLDAEVDLGACERTGTEVNRRPTGGGAIVMGAGQLGVAVATRAPARQRPRDLLERYSQGIVAGLDRVGISARFRGKNDLEVGGRKIAGLGLYLDGNGGLLFHASVLADLDVAFMLEVLDIPAAKLGARAVSAVEERVTTVTRQTARPWDGRSLAPHIAAGFAATLGVVLEAGSPTRDELELTRRLVAERYGTVAWRQEYSPRPDATATATARLDGGLVRLYLALTGDTIKSLLFTGDFNAVPPPLVAIEEALRWKRMDRAVVERAVSACLAEHPDIARPEVIVEAILQAGARLADPPVAAPPRDGSCYFPDDDRAPIGTEVRP
ncbi:hypothetical protein GHK86_00100 [Acidimicrobiaceae bacterium USS-CC1]|uniref:BPL/LPL catalytic domain-containing protein n=1 Tax=Acidiferrimicrobium australe TaxID=2664430 RepID=A0ABW9QNH4_9ACTN|nr:hypothetical protein [Acidiferrimicrobium australe]